ncbi:RidA family protein [Iamia sp. SCSIO 61187]|uniref:RidA family protein n=1 Tax=Iamia sp. SCSIO 61187 TaxID=2722752 RepID=UPI001C63601E|nr:RidA family protein [Iamia sp. SCSIO 61187]QYG95058.1 RidA family protein [Iamia sp. SCSIO 61187]
MTVELINPPGIPEPMGYAQVGVATGSRTVYVSGQVARTADGSPVAPGDLAGQVEQAYANLIAALAGAGASYADVAKVTAYVVDLTEEKLGPFVEGAMRVAEAHGIDPTRPMTMIGVAALAEPDLLVEIEAVAVLD